MSESDARESLISLLVTRDEIDDKISDLRAMRDETQANIRAALSEVLTDEVSQHILVMHLVCNHQKTAEKIAENLRSK